MSFGKIRIRKADTIFRQYLLKTRGERCEYCGKQGRIEVSHYHGRRKEATRFCEKNCALLCNFHHRNFHENPASYVEWMKKRLGEKEYNKLTISANSYCKRDDKLQEIYWRNKLNNL